VHETHIQQVPSGGFPQSFDIPHVMREV